MKEYSAKLGDYTLGRKLGTGQFSKVRVGTKDGVNYAAKYMLKSNDLFKNKTCLELVFNEAKIMIQLDHPNIVKLHEFSDNGVVVKGSGKQVPVLYLIFELITGGEMFDYIAVGGRFSDGLSRYYFKQLISSLEYLYSKGYAHRDIKAENILMDDKCNLKLADFGFATLMAGKDGSGKLHSQKGTLGYMAPELNMGHAYSGEKVDLFAVGVLLFTMVAQHPPFRKASAQDPFYKLFCQQNDLFWTKMASGKPAGVFSPNFKAMINSLLAYNPTMRPTIAEIKAHPWWNDLTPSAEEVRAEVMNRRFKVESDWKERAKEAAEKKKFMKEQMAKKKTALGGYGAHMVTKSATAEAGTVAKKLARILQEYKVAPQTHLVAAHSRADNAVLG